LLRWIHLPIEYVIPHHTLVAETLIRELKAAGKKILVWTVNSPAQMRRLRDWGVDGIISDDTRLLVQTLD
jgi:glycerophosphoryl diester phosphodiesterase